MTWRVTEADRIPAYGWRSGAWKARKRAPVAVVWHTTGSGVIRRYRRDPDKYGSPFGAALWVFRNQRAGAHYVIGQGGEIAQLAPESVVAWHVGRRKGWRYARYNDPWLMSDAYRWWRARWWPRGIYKPIHLAGGRLWLGGRCNENTIGVEVVPPAEDPTGPWSGACWATVRDLARSLPVAVMPDRHIGHSDAHPLSRTRHSMGWDPSHHAWDPFIHHSRCTK